MTDERLRERIREELRLELTVDGRDLIGAIARVISAREQAAREEALLRYGREKARNTVFMQAMATLARRGEYFAGFARDTVRRADEAAANVRLEDFTVAHVPTMKGPGEKR